MLKLKPMAIDTYRENVAYLSRDCPLYRAEKFQGLAKIEVSRNGRSILAVLNIIDDAGLLGADELGLSESGFRQLGLPAGEIVQVAQALPPASREAVRAKVLGETLSPADFEAIIRDIAANRYSKMEIAAFLIASASFLTTDEVLGLTRAMAAVGSRLTWPDQLVVDKHCIGGIPGNRTSMIVVPIVAAHGLTIPKTSSRSITSPAGTADTMEVLARVEIDIDEMRDIVRATHGCIVWGGHVNLAPADDILISVERPLGIDTREQLVASILSKKLSAGSSHLVIDIPAGPTAKVRTHADAIRLRKLFEFVGDQLGLVVRVEITDGSQPVGNGIGPMLEARDVMRVLENDPLAPRDLRARALLLAGHILDFDPGLRGGKGHARALELLESGAAARQMELIMTAQGSPPARPDLGPLRHDVPAEADGIVASIDCYRLARLARIAGAPTDKGAGIDLFRKVGDPVQKGEPLYRIHAAHPTDFRFATSMVAAGSGYQLNPAR
ncbi:thymidine phosphorylase [Dongia mobilis]|uniref:Putative thymidine phosphorylase n=1 Tax=Dongia mobilis TaxID=578943 RepID=A0A4R6WJT4_9PROT|nr:thymidine phosphorylase family protein [Dongia mobilis]TDQ78898.1 thymidine phosphorylase [Dongia mobilis]